MKSKLFLLAFIMIMVMGLASATTLGTVKLGNTINITQACTGATYSNISLIQVDWQTLNNTQIVMTSVAGKSFVYQYLPPRTGYYYVLTHCDDGGVDTPYPMDFWVTSNGDANTNNNATSLTLILIVLALIFMFIGNSMDSRKWLIKSVLYFVALLIMLIAIGFGIQMAGSSNVSKLFNSALIIGASALAVFIVYIFVTYMTELVKAIKASRSEKKEQELL